MSTCTKCGNQMPDNAKFCGVCGTPLEVVNVTGTAPTAEADKVVAETAANAEAVGGTETTATTEAATESMTAEATTTETPIAETVTAGAAQQFGNGTQQFGNGTQQFGNGAQQFGNGTQQFGNGTQQFGNGTQQFGNGAQQFGNGAQQFGNGAQQFGNGAQQFGNGAQQFQKKESTAEYYGKLPYTAPAEDAEANKGVAICAYFSLLWIVPLCTTAKHSPFVKFHTNQAIVNTIVSLLVGVVLGIFGWMLDFIFWGFFWAPTLFGVISVLFSLGLTVWGIVYAAQGKMKEIPLIGEFRLLK